MSDILELRKKIKSNNILLRSHWNIKRIDKKEFSLLIRSQMRLKIIEFIEPRKKCSILVISYRKRLLDYDNLVGGCKQLVDAMIEECLIHDDSPDFLDIKYEQYKAKEEHTMIIRKLC